MCQKSLRAYARMYAKILIGGIIFAFGFRVFLYNNGMFSGGTAGLGMIVNQLTDLPIGMLTLAFNIPLFMLAWRKLGFRFMVDSTVAMLVCTSLMDIMSLVPIQPTEDMLLGAIYGGILKGVGLGLIYSEGLATGGGDVTVRLLRRKYPYVNLGTIMLCIDGAIVMVYALLFMRFDKSMYTMISMFVASKVIDIILYGSMNAKLCFIISDCSDKVQEAITNELHRGVTLLDGHGAYTGNDKKVILCIVKKNQMVEARSIARAIDPAAFFVVTDAQEVFGKGFSDIMSND
ncbi:MAG: YitT family protein [Candidatus Heteroscillospira sp.]|jgi:uncharacterized membrane-anchored protein YitT (DUF2179 family)